MFKYIFITLLVAAVWGVVLWLELPMWIAIAVTATAVVIIATILIVKAVRARKASREIEKALKAQAEQQANSARPDLEADIRALQGEFNRAITALKGSRLGAKGATSALYALPWYVIVGPPGVGKSTALRNSGLKFPFLSSRGGVSVQGVGGTRNCEWWMTSEAVILDTAGRYTTEGADREEWFAFLDLLRKYRTRRPINGVLAAVSIADLSEAHPEEVATLAREIRARIDELQDRLGVVVPVYLVFTKCDLLPGFVEMFDDLKGEERHRIWGFTLPARDQVDLVGQFGENYDELTAVLEKRTLRRLAEERSAERREKIHEFPQYVAALRDPLSRFIHEVTQENIYHETPILRGVYLSSGTQEGRPINRIMNSIAEAFGIQPTIAATAAPPTEAKSYFLGELFRNVVFPDYRITRPSRLRVRKQKIIGNIVGGLAVAAAIGIVWLPLVAFKENREMVTDAGVALAYVEQHTAEDTVDAIAVERIEPLRAVVDQLKTYEEEGSPYSMRMGMYQGAIVYPRLRDVYAATIRKELLLPSIEQELAEMQRFVMRYGVSAEEASTEEYEAFFDRLRMYLLVTSPVQSGEPGLNEEEKEWLSAELSDTWERPLRVSGDSATLSSIEAVARAYVEMLAVRPELAFERNTKMVNRVRRVLKQSDRSKTVANALIESVDGPSLKLTSMVAVSAIRNDERVIRPAFTRQGYEEQVKPRFEGKMDDLLDEQWVLGRGDEDADELKSEEIEAIKTEYFRQYIAEWKNFIDSIYVDAPSNMDTIDAMGLLADLTRGNDPYKDLFTHIAWHTQLVDLNARSGEVDKDGNPLLKELGRQAKLRARQKARLGRIGVNQRVTELATKQATASILADPAAALVVTDLNVTYAFKGLSDFGARKAAAQQAQPGAPPPPPEAVPLDEYTEQLKYVRDALQARLDDPEEHEKLQSKVKTARSKTKALLGSHRETGWGPTLEKLLYPPLDLVWKDIDKGMATQVNDKWCNEVVATFERTIGSSYPFNSAGHDIALADFNAFFEREKGDIWRYYDGVLKTRIPLRGTRYELAEQGESTTGRLRGSLVSFLNAANEITTSMYPRGGEDMSISFDVQIQGAPGIKEISLTVDGETIKYRNGPEVWGTLKWPGEGSPGARIEAHGFGKEAELEREGEWGLFRVLEQGTVRAQPDQRVFVVQWDFQDEGAGRIQMRFRPKRADTPFFGVGGRKRFMTIFRTKNLIVPRQITTKAQACRVGRRKE